MKWESFFAKPGNWYKGNLHIHTSQSDGGLTPEEVIHWYREHGYDFLALSDHWVLTPGRKFDGADDFTTVSGVEMHGQTYHLLALGISNLPERALGDSIQAVIDAVVDQKGLAFLAHPFRDGHKFQDIAALQGLTGIEVFNSFCETPAEVGNSSTLWDELSAHKIRLLGLAVDDGHWRPGRENEGKGFVMVRAQALSEVDLLQAIRRGQFYASTGPAITDLRVVKQADGTPALRVRCSPCQSIIFFFSSLTHPDSKWRPGYREKFEAVPGMLLDSATCRVSPEKGYLRIECRDERGRTAWCNPVFVEDLLD